MTDRCQQLVDEARRAIVRQAQVRFDVLLDFCESPIERVVLAQLLLDGFDGPPFTCGDLDDLDACIDLAESVLFTRYKALLRMPMAHYVLVVQGTWRDKYRSDFTLLNLRYEKCKVWVELDGHDFHERTPEQAERDKSRDRDLVFEGWTVMRFTGREVVRSPTSVVGEIRAMCERLAR